MEEKVLASCSGVVKIFKGNISQTPREHSSTISLVRVSSNFYLQQDGNGVKKTRLKIRGENVMKLETRRLSEGFLTIILSKALWQTVAIVKADVGALKKLIGCLENLKGSSKWPPSCGSWAKISPLSSSSVSPNAAQRHSAIPALMKHPNNSRPVDTSSPVEVNNYISSGFYGSSSLEPFLPETRSPHMTPHKTYGSASSVGGDRLSSRDRSPHGYSSISTSRLASHSSSPSKEKPRRPFFHSARRSLALSEKPRTNEAEDDFKTDPKFISLSEGSLPTKFEQASSTSIDGFANFGNTCYMNAVLQSLVGMEPFANDILNQKLVQAAQKGSLYLMLYLLVKSKRSKDSFKSQSVLLKKVKVAISSRAEKFRSYRQQDAHELLSQCLDQVKDEVRNPQLQLLNEPLCPVVRNFECEILRTLTCKSCKKETNIKEVVYDFALQLPKSVLVRPNQQANLQQLFAGYFAEEEVEYSCTGCDCKMAVLKQRLSKLPRIMILHLKRYGYSTLLSKRKDHIRIPRFINTGDLCAADYVSPIEYKGSWPRDSSSLSSLVEENKENTGPLVAQPHIPLADIASVPIVASSPLVPGTPSVPTLNPSNLLPSPVLPEGNSSVPEVKIPPESGNSGCGKGEGPKPKESSKVSEDMDRFVPTLTTPACFEFAFDDDDEMKLALEESLKSQQSEVQMLRQMEEEQLQLALDLSIKESSGLAEAPPPSPTKYVPVASPVSSQGPIEAYKLVSIVSHLGRGSGGGHYISDVYSLTSRNWKTFNDEYVSEAREEDLRQLRQTTGYIFFYMHRSICRSVEKLN